MLGEIVSDRLSKGGCVGGDVEQVVAHLKRDSVGQAERAQRLNGFRRRSAGNRAALRGGGKERGGLPLHGLYVSVERNVQIAERSKLQHLAVADFRERRRENIRNRGRIVLRDVFEYPCEQIVAGQHAYAVSVIDRRRVNAAARLRVVDDVVVNERGDV